MCCVHKKLTSLLCVWRNSFISHKPKVCDLWKHTLLSPSLQSNDCSYQSVSRKNTLKFGSFLKHSFFLFCIDLSLKGWETDVMSLALGSQSQASRDGRWRGLECGVLNCRKTQWLPWNHNSDKQENIGHMGKREDELFGRFCSIPPRWQITRS